MVLQLVTCYRQSHHDRPPSATGRPRTRAPHHPVGPWRDDRGGGPKAGCPKAQGRNDPNSAQATRGERLCHSLGGGGYVPLPPEGVGRECRSECSERNCRTVL